MTRNFCSICFHFMHYHSHLLASRFGIPLIVNGRTRSQIYQNALEEKGLEPFELSHSLKAFEYQMFGRLLDKLEGNSCVDFLPDAEVTSLSYFTYHKVSDEEKIGLSGEGDRLGNVPKTPSPTRTAGRTPRRKSCFWIKTDSPYAPESWRRWCEAASFPWRIPEKSWRRTGGFTSPPPDPEVLDALFERVGMK